MCGQFMPLNYDDFEESAWALTGKNTASLAAMYNMNGVMLPSMPIPALTASGAGFYTWGLTHQSGSLVINARSEGIKQSRMFSGLLHAGRCVVPAAAYFEWLKLGKLRCRYKITGQNRLPLYFAALCTENTVLSSSRCVIITTAAADNIDFIHDRMPLCLTAAQAKAWLSHGCDGVIGTPPEVALTACRDDNQTA